MTRLSFKNMLLVGLLAIEIIIFGMMYFFGNYGIKQLNLARSENDVLLQEVNELKNNVQKLEKQLQDWQDDSFYKEKIARERLHMSKSNEQIYHLS